MTTYFEKNMTRGINELEARAQASPWLQGVEIVLMQGMAFGKEIIMHEVPEGEIIDPTFKLGYKQAQILMDDLWQAGIRPSDGKSNTGELKATEKHLQDMRTIAFNKLEIDNK